MTNTSWSKLQKKYSLRIKFILLLKEKEDPEDCSTDKRENKQENWIQPQHIVVQKLIK